MMIDWFSVGIGFIVGACCGVSGLRYLPAPIQAYLLSFLNVADEAIDNAKEEMNDGRQ